MSVVIACADDRHGAHSEVQIISFKQSENITRDFLLCLFNAYTLCRNVGSDRRLEIGES